MSRNLSKSDYLKKYLSEDNKKTHKKKKKKLENNGKTRVKIIDDDIDVINNDGDGIDELIILTGEDAPQIVGIIDDRPPELRLVEDFKSSGKWKNLPPSDGKNNKLESSNRIYKNNENRNLNSGKKNDEKQKIDRSSSEDLSPQRKNKIMNVERRKHKDSSEDLSPRRRTSRDTSNDMSSKRKQIDKYSSKDLSPIRKNSRRSSDDLVPKRKQIDKHSREDLSPKRKNSKRSSDDLTSKRKHIDKYSSEDLSPKRERIDKNYSDLNMKRSRVDKDKTQKDSNSKYLNSKQKRNKTSKHEANNQRSKSVSSERNTLQERKTLDGKSVGLQDAEALKKESEKFRKQEHELFMKMSNGVSGKDAEVAVRNSSIKHRKDRKGLDKNPEEMKKKMELEKEKQEIYNRWGKGLKQIEDYRNKVAEEQYEMSKPLARYSDDADLDEILKKQEREGDPMLEYMKKKDKTKNTNEKVIPIYQGSFPENRFNIRPGYRWDGVDRSNGYEKRWFEAQSKRKAMQEEAYKYSTEDM